MNRSEFGIIGGGNVVSLLACLIDFGKVQAPGVWSALKIDMHV